MLKIIRSRKQFQLLSFLALFYFVIGAHVLHPHFHHQADLGPANSHQYFASKTPHHPSINGLDNSEHHSCPICNFFAANSAVEINTVCFFIPSFPDRQALSDCPMAVMLAHQTHFQIRGPPSIIPA